MTREKLNIYIDDVPAMKAKLDKIGLYRNLIAREGRSAGRPNRSAVIVTLVDEELARIAAEQARRT